MNYLSVESVTKSFGERVLFTDVSFGINKGQKVALIGINGSGKSTLFNIITGKESPDNGNIAFRNDISIGYLDQNPQFDPEGTLADAIFSGDNSLLKLIRDYEFHINLDNPNAKQQQKLQDLLMDMDTHQAWDYESQVKQILGKLNLYELDKKVGHLSGGQKKRIALANLLITDPDFLILDEPTNHLDLDVIEWLEGLFSTQQKTLLMVTHDRYFLESITNEILELEQGKIYSYHGSYSYFLQKKNERETQQVKAVEKARNLMRKELDWIRRQPKARGTKAKYRIDAFEDIKTKASSGKKEDNLNLEVIDRRQGKKILELAHLQKSFPGRIIVENFSYTFKKSDRIGVIGKNGTGKTTFLNMLTGKIAPDSGSIELGQNTVIGYYTQQEISFPDDKKVIEVVTDIAEVIKKPDGNELTASQLLLHFQFSPAMQYNYVERLSGGEKRRLQLLTVLIKNPNFLILDEPTNDLDIVTLNILEDYLEQYNGCLMIVTHDRYFMDKLVDHLFVFEGEGNIKDFPGNYTDHRLWSSEREEKAAGKPKENKKQTLDSSKEKTKLSFKEQREYKQLEKEIATLEDAKAKIVAKLNSGKGSHEDLTKWSLEIEELNKKIDNKSDRWLELSEYS